MNCKEQRKADADMEAAYIADMQKARAEMNMQFNSAPKIERMYLAGPMSGYEDHNQPAFMRTAARLRKQGFFVINPAELNPPTSGYAEALRLDIAVLMQCDTIYLMIGWERSKGACLEHHIATVLGLRVSMEREDCNPNVEPITPIDPIVAGYVASAGISADLKKENAQLKAELQAAQAEKPLNLREHLANLSDKRGPTDNISVRVVTEVLSEYLRCKAIPRQQNATDFNRVRDFEDAKRWQASADALSDAAARIENAVRDVYAYL